MNNRAIKKLLSVVLVMAICVSTVFGCLITVNAADTAATYTITAESLFAYADEGKATMTFNLDSGFTSGSFTLLKNDNITHSTTYGLDENGEPTLVPSPWDYEYNDVEVKVVGGTTADGTVVTADEMSINLFYDTNKDNENDIEQQTETTDILCPNNVLWFNADAEGNPLDYKDAEGNNFSFDPEAGTVYRHKDYKLSDVTFDSGEVAYKSITLELNLEFAYCMQPNSQNYIRIANATQKDQDGNNYGDPVLKNGETSYTLSENIVEGNINYLHSHTSNDVKINGQLVQQNDYSIYTDKCKFCGAVKNQLVSDELTSNQPNAYYDISAMNIVYEDDGTVSLNLHCPGFQGVKEKLVISYSDGTKTIYGDNKTSEIAGNSSFKVSPYAKDKITDEETGKFTYSDNVLPNGTYMYEIKGLSAKDIESKFYLTRIVKGSGQWEGGIFCGHTQEVSLSDYCTDVVEGEKVYYPAGTTAEQIAADKAVAVAFINYGVAAANALNHKVSYEKEEITVTDTWNGEKVEPTTTDEAGNIIINTAEELAWVAMDTTAATTGKNYKVAPNSVFDMKGFDGITLDSTAAQVKTATKLGNNWGNNSAVFYGNFDGNGLIVYNISGTPGLQYGGLFTAVKNVDSTIKNVTVKASAFYGYHYGGGLIGLADGNLYTVNISNCAVENCYISDNKATEGAWDLARTAGTIIGGSANAGIVMKDCYAANNLLDAQEIEGGFIGKSSDWGTGIKISNCISVGTNPYSTIVGTESINQVVLGGKLSAATYTNVYTDVESTRTGVTVLGVANMKGSAAETNMSALDWNNVWVTTDSYPAFNPDIYCTDVWDGTVATGFAGGTGTDEDPYIIATAEQLAFLVRGAGSTTTESTTRYKHYKIADGIKYFNMNGFTNITLNSSVDDIDMANANTTNNWCNGLVTDKNQVFQGFFDGNGVVIYNIYASGKYAGLFPCANGDINANSTYGDTSVSVKYPLKIENVTVDNSYFVSPSNSAGGIIGSHQNYYRSGIIINNCAVDNCWFDTTSGYTGAIIGDVLWEGDTTINNCLVADNKFTKNSQAVTGSVVGTNASTSNRSIKLNNSIVIDATPYTDGNTGLSTGSTFTNVYTTESSNSISGITTLTTAQIQGDAAIENMPGLAWGAEWFEGKDGEYPSINGEVYADTWDGTKVEPTTTDSEGNIIINTAEELAWVILQGGTATQDKNYKVADGMKYFNMNGMTGITVDSTATDVKSATKTANNWRYEADGNSRTYAFRGNFDGNGVTIYNIYAAGYERGALFPYIYNDSTIENVSVKASFLSGYQHAAGIVGVGELQKTININKCAVENCYITDNGNTNSTTTKAAAQFVAGTGNSNVNISNCLAANNTLSAAGYEAGFIAISGDYIQKGISITNSISIGMYPYSNAKNGGALGKGLTQQLTVLNVYSDVACDIAGVTTIDADDAKGAGAATAMPNLGWGTDWFTGKPGEYPCFVDDGVEYVPDDIEALLVANGYYSDFVANFENNYKRDSFTTNDENCNFYATGLTLKTNPYMTVTLVLHDTYRTNKANVEAVFTVNGQEIKVMGNEMVNNANAGRYHMVRLKDIKIMNLCDDITVTLNYNGLQVGTGSISVAGFAFTAADAGEGFEYYETAAQALVFYAEALQNRYAARNAVQ